MLPTIEHLYQNHHLDSARWQHYRPRPGDIIISTSYRSGTTWTQQIVRQLILWNQPDEVLARTPVMEASPWLDLAMPPLEEMIARLEAQQHRRFIKSHLPLDALPYYPQVKYLIIGRDPRDVFMSLSQFYAGFSDHTFATANGNPERVGPPLLRCPDNIHEVWRNWITRGWFDWEQEGYPFWGNMRHSQSWWNYRHLPNIHFAHYNDLLTHLPDEVQRIADFLEIPITREGNTALLPALTFDTMRRDGDNTLPGPAFSWNEGAQTFFFKGTNGRWRELLTDEELAMYEATASQVLTPECRAWLEQGRTAWEMPKPAPAQSAP